MDVRRATAYFRAMSDIPEQNRLSTQTFSAWGDAFTPAELDRIEAIGDGLAREKAILLTEAPELEVVERIRITETAWMRRNDQTAWLYARMQQAIRDLNAQIWKYELTGFSEAFQYTVYRGEEGGHYDWHIDHGPLPVQRKLSVSLQLSDGDSYEGADLEFMAGNRIQPAPRERGAIIVFPSYVLHRVTPVTRGVRKSLVVWVTGPNFR
jgi:PKHD-type hydroxylase